MPLDSTLPMTAGAVTTARSTFDLTREPWLPVLYVDGSEGVLSLVDVLGEAARIRRLVGDVPTQELALLRLLLAILYDALDGPEDLDSWEELWEQEGLPQAELTAYLATHRESFDLLHPVRPFFQVAGLRTEKNDVSALDRIVADVPNRGRFFSMRAEGAQWLDFAEAARWVVHAQAFDPSGIKTGAVGDPRAKGGKVYPLGVGWVGELGGVLVEGRDLRDTLLLNLIAREEQGWLRHDKGDMPVWRHPEPPGPGPLVQEGPEARPFGPRDLYTWQSRRIRLHHDGARATGVVLSYGDPLQVRNKHGREPMTGWRRSEAQEKKHALPQVYMPRGHDPTRSAWRGLGSLVAGHPGGGQASTSQRREGAEGVCPRVLEWVAKLAVQGPLEAAHPIRVRLLGCEYGTQQSVVNDLVDDSVAMPVVVLMETDAGLGRAAVDAVSDADAAVQALGDLATDLAHAAGVGHEPRRAEARDLGYGSLDGPYRQWLADLRPEENPEAARTRWQKRALSAVRALGESLVAGAGEAAWEGRTVKTATGSLWLNAASADLAFRRRLRTNLSRAFPDTLPPQQTEESPA